MADQRPLSVFISYSHLDEDVVRKLGAHLSSLQLEGAIDKWHDRRITAGSDWHAAIDAELQSADIVLLLITSNFVQSQYCVGIEATEAIRRHLAGEARVVPLIIGHVDWKRLPIGSGDSAGTSAPRASTRLGMLNALPTDGKPVRDVRSWSSEDEAYLDIAEGLRRLVVELAPKSAPVREDLPPPPPPSSTQPPGKTDTIVATLTTLLRLDHATYFIGSRFSSPRPELRHGPADVACHLLGQRGMNWIDGGWDKLLPSLDSVGTYYGIRYGIPVLEDEVHSFHARRSHDVPTAHSLLAELLVQSQRHYLELQRLQLRKLARPPQLIVTTNTDQWIERALFSAGVSFTRIVQHLSEPKLTVTDVRELSTVPVAGSSAGGGNRRIRVQLPGDDPSIVRDFDPDKLSEVNQGLSLFTQEEVTFRSFTHPDTVSNQNPLESYPVKRLRGPILYKLRGSEDVRMSCGFTTEQYLEFVLRMASRFVPTQIREIIAQTPSLFYGYSYLDPEFRLLYYTFEEALVERQTNVYPLYAVQQHPDQELHDNYRRMELGIWDQLKEFGPRKARITTVEESPETFLRKMIQQFEERRDVA